MVRLLQWIGVIDAVLSIFSDQPKSMAIASCARPKCTFGAEFSISCPELDLTTAHDDFLGPTFPRSIYLSLGSEVWSNSRSMTCARSVHDFLTCEVDVCLGNPTLWHSFSVHRPKQVAPISWRDWRSLRFIDRFVSSGVQLHVVVIASRDG